MDKPVTIASRRSPLAVAQAEAVRAMLGEASGLAQEALEEAFPIKTYVTTGDINMAGSLSDVGGKGLFVKEVEMALLTGEADIAVHSMKDMPAVMPEGLVQTAVPEREDPRDAFVTLDGRAIDDLEEGAVIGTSSVRRKAQLLRRRPDLRIVPFRGNVATRLQKLANKEAEGTFLAEAGLRRLGRTDVKRSPQPIEAMLPALGQGALCIQCREDDETSLALGAKITHIESELATWVERAFVAQLDGSCRTPMAGIAIVRDDDIIFRAEILMPEGDASEAIERAITLGSGERNAKIRAAFEHGKALGEEILHAASPKLRHVLTGV
jgi:hydroxymethylbilane synthase